MKNLKIISSAIVTVALLSSSAYAAVDSSKAFYVKPSAGFAGIAQKTSTEVKGENDKVEKNTQKQSSAGFAGKVAAGYNISENFAAELDFALYSAKPKDKSSKLTGYSAFLNGYYNFMPDKQFSPYVKAGLGYISMKQSPKDNKNESMSNSSPALNVGLGAVYNFSETMFLDAAYTFTMSTKSKPKFGKDMGKDAVNLAEAAKMRVSSNIHALTVGVGFRF